MGRRAKNTFAQKSLYNASYYMRRKMNDGNPLRKNAQPLNGPMELTRNLESMLQTKGQKILPKPSPGNCSLVQTPNGPIAVVVGSGPVNDMDSSPSTSNLVPAHQASQPKKIRREPLKTDSKSMSGSAFNAQPDSSVAIGPKTAISLSSGSGGGRTLILPSGLSPEAIKSLVEQLKSAGSNGQHTNRLSSVLPLTSTSSYNQSDDSKTHPSICHLQDIVSAFDHPYNDIPSTSAEVAPEPEHDDDSDCDRSQDIANGSAITHHTDFGSRVIKSEPVEEEEEIDSGPSETVGDESKKDVQKLSIRSLLEKTADPDKPAGTGTGTATISVGADLTMNFLVNPAESSTSSNASEGTAATPRVESPLKKGAKASDDFEKAVVNVYLWMRRQRGVHLPVSERGHDLDLYDTAAAVGISRFTVTRILKRRRPEKPEEEKYQY